MRILQRVYICQWDIDGRRGTFVGAFNGKKKGYAITLSFKLKMSGIVKESIAVILK
jgi:hypothetical protein